MSYDTEDLIGLLDYFLEDDADVDISGTLLVTLGDESRMVPGGSLSIILDGHLGTQNSEYDEDDEDFGFSSQSVTVIGHNVSRFLRRVSDRRDEAAHNWGMFYLDPWDLQQNLINDKIVVLIKRKKK